MHDLLFRCEPRARTARRLASNPLNRVTSVNTGKKEKVAEAGPRAAASGFPPMKYPEKALPFGRGSVTAF